MKNNFYRTQVNLGSDSWVRLSLRHRRCADLTDVTLSDEDTNSKLTDNAKRAIQGNEAMQVMQVMQAMQVMQVMPVMPVMQVMQVM